MVFSNVPLAILNRSITLGHPLTVACANKALCIINGRRWGGGRRGREIEGQGGEQEGEMEVRRGWRWRWREGEWLEGEGEGGGGGRWRWREIGLPQWTLSD